jgi:hypothetical protein
MGSVASSSKEKSDTTRSIVADPPDRVYSFIHLLYRRFEIDNQNKKNDGSSGGVPLRIHLHTETMALSPNYRGIYSELGHRLVFQADRPGWAILDDLIPIHVVLNAEATQVLECFRSADVLVLTSSSSFGRLGGLLSGTNRVVAPSPWLGSTSKFLRREFSSRRGGGGDAESLSSSSVEDGGEEEEEEEEEYSGRSFASLLWKSALKKYEGINLLTWCFASLGAREKARWHGYDELDSPNVVDFIFQGRGSSSSKVGLCPIELNGNLERTINRKNILRIETSKSLLDRQDPLSHGLELFGGTCKKRK